MPTHRPTTFSVSLIGVVAAAAAAVTFALPVSSAGARQVDRAHAVSTTTTTKATPGTDAVGDTLLTEPQQGYQPVDAFILGATKSVDMTMYELADPVVESDLGADAHRGVTVQVVLDQEYSGKPVNLAAYDYLVAHQVQVVWSYPSEIFHQKTITVDGRTSLIMTGNLTSKYYPTTRDFGVFDTNAADVSAIEAAFASDFAGHRPAPAAIGADLVWSPGSEVPLVALINSAQHTLTVENEEMDSTGIESALEAAAQRGVQVEVTMTYSSEWTAALDRLNGAGVKVRLYHGEHPIYVHAKVISVDAGQPDQRAFIGSENFSTSSLVYNRELGLVTTNPVILTPLNATLQADFVGNPTR
jgi:cardiolipin synthase A/B